MTDAKTIIKNWCAAAGMPEPSDGECHALAVALSEDDSCLRERITELLDTNRRQQVQIKTLEARNERLEAELVEMRELLREALEALTCGDTGDDLEDSHRCGRCDEYVDRDATLRRKIRAAIEEDKQ